MMRVVKGALAPADTYAASVLRSRNYRVNDVVAVEVTKCRSPGFHRLAHSLGGLLAENLDAFAGCDPHAVLKRLQIEANVGCDEIALNFPGVGPCSYRVPRSLSYESLDEIEFHQIIGEMCSYVVRTYWPSLTPEQVENMASAMVEAA
jgi:hypothetical protein